MADSLQQVASDPQFATFSDDQKRAIIGRIDPSFAQLGTDDQAKVLSRLTSSGDVRSQIAARQANPPATAKGDPNAIPQTTLETYAPFIAHPIETGKGFVGSVAGGVNALAHPIQTVQNDAQARSEAYQRMTQRGMMTDDPEQLRDAVSVALPLIGPAMAQVGTQLNSQNPVTRAQGMGGGLAMVAGPEMLKDAMGAAMPTQAGALKTMRQVVDPKGTGGALADEVAQNMLDRKQIVRDPRASIEQYAESKAQSGDQALTQAVAKMPNLDAKAIAAKLQKIKESLYNPETGAPLRPDSDQIAAKIDAYSANHVLGNSSAMITPDGQPAFSMDPKVALELKRNFDAKPYGKGSETGDAQAQQAIGDTLREQINTDPEAAAANADINKNLTIKKKIAPNAATDTLPDAEKVGRAMARTVGAELVGQAFPPLRGYAHAAAATLGLPSLYSVVSDTIRSPLWKTTSAVTKAQFAKAIAAKDFNAAAQISGRILGTKKEDQ